MATDSVWRMKLLILFALGLISLFLTSVWKIKYSQWLQVKSVDLSPYFNGSYSTSFSNIDQFLVSSEISRNHGFPMENTYTMSGKQAKQATTPIPFLPFSEKRNIAKKIVYTKGWTNLRQAFSQPIVKRFERYSPQYCDGYKCAIETKNSWDTAGADIAVFFGIELKGQPPDRLHRQLWAFQTGESQRSLAASHPQMWDGLFNYSLTYLRSSKSNEYDLSWSRHFTVRDVPLLRNFYREKLQMVGKKELNALWFVSNCAGKGIFQVQSGRVEYAHSLSDHVKVDAFTRQNDCKTKLGTMLRTKDGGEASFNNYWFYLSFENSLCKDYITEKFWKIITSDSLAIPVVLGGSGMRDYEAIAPPNSYIDVRNFTSPRHLAQHLKYVTENEDAFNYYHRWRNEYELASYERPGEL